MSEREIAIKIKRKQMYFQRIQRMYDLCKSIKHDKTREDEKKVKEFFASFELLEETRINFTSILDEINELQCSLDSAYEPNYKELDTVDIMYSWIKLSYKSLSPTPQQTSTVMPQMVMPKRQLELPRLSLPEFDGNESEWKLFSESFKNSVIDNDDLSNVDRVRYLVGLLRGRAFKLVSGIPALGDNFVQMWKLLTDRYEDPRTLSDSYLSKMFKFKPLVKETAQNLDNFLQEFVNAAQSLLNLKLADSTGVILLYLATQRLPQETVKQFESYISSVGKQQDLPTIQTLISFLHDHVKVVSRTTGHTESVCNRTSGVRELFNKPVRSNYSAPKALHVKESSLNKCPVCSASNHRIYSCGKFSKLNPTERWNLVKRLHLCFNCLSNRHTLPMCQSNNTCSKCNSRHHSSLHVDKTPQFGSTAVIKSDQPSAVSNLSHPRDSQPTIIESSPAVVCSSSAVSSPSTVLLSTALVTVFDHFGNPHIARALLDSASQCSLCTTDLCNKLNLRKHKISSSITGVGSQKKPIKFSSIMKIASRTRPDTSYALDVFIIDQITENIPSVIVSHQSLSHFEGLPLADETYFKPGKIDLLIGAALYPHLMLAGKICGASHEPVALNTTLGYVVLGPVGTQNSALATHNCFLTSQEPTIEQLVSRFMELESIPVISTLSKEDQDCENLFANTTSRDESGKYSVTLPFAKSPDLLGDTKDNTLRRFISLEKRLIADPVLRKHYNSCISDFIKQGHMTKLDSDPSVGCYLPHFCVYKESSSTPVRVVWDAGAKSTSGYSLNSLLHTGPRLQQDLLSILLNFRLFAVALNADIHQFYRQILVHKEHRKYQKILWRFDSSEDVGTYVLNVVVFGIKPSPYLALRTLKQLAIDYASEFPLASSFALKSFYIDDFVSSVPTERDAFNIFNELNAMFSKGGFKLTKWNSNSNQFLNNVPNEDCLANNIQFSDYCAPTKILGLCWNPEKDIFYFNVTPPTMLLTKRNALSVLARIFDVMGLLSPVTSLAKIMIKDLWNAKLDWDEKPPDSLSVSQVWHKFVSQLPLLSNFQVPRFVSVVPDTEAELCGFADASSRAYGAVVYVRVPTASGVKITLLCSKARVAPAKVLSIPRLELCAAVVLARLVSYVKKSLNDKFKFSNLYAFSDSEVVLHWLAAPSARWKTFVANRVAFIQTTVPDAIWLKVSSQDNVADSLSRGMLPYDFLQFSEWLNGPSWLYLDKNLWPASPKFSSNIDQNELEINRSELNQVVCPTIIDDSLRNFLRNLIDTAISYDGLLRKIFRLLFKWILKSNSNVKTPSYLHLDKAERALIIFLQNEFFSSEISRIEQGLDCSPRLRKLRPIINDGILVVGGRLSNAHLSYEQKHPILLPSKDRAITLLCQKYHTQALHTGADLVFSMLRQKYWILGGRDTVRRIVQRCNFCFRHRPRSLTPIMGDLPPERFAENKKAFFHTGTDYAGPFSIIASRKRGVVTHNAYLCLFVCLTTKAVHLELATDLSTNAFINALKRFLARRGPINMLLSDNGTNYIGAQRQINAVYEVLNAEPYRDAVFNLLNSQRIQFRQIPPRAPHFGGVWESQIKSAKRHLIKVVGEQKLSFEELYTLITQVEAVLNSRPLTLLSSDPADPSPLTPAHFLHQGPLSSVPAPDTSHLPLSHLHRYQVLDRLLQDFWKRWHVEYLHTLQSRERWNSQSCPARVGTIVLIKTENCPPFRWPIGVIEQLHPGKDGVARVATVRTRGHTFKRPVVKLCPLPTQ